MWTLSIGGYLYLIIEHDYIWAYMCETILFSLLSIQLIVINLILLRLMKKLFSAHMLEKNFKHEMRFLIWTLVLFSISYLATVLKNIAILWLLENYHDDEGERHQWLSKVFCTSNFNIVMFNIGTYIVTELIPYIVIFLLNYHNYR